MTRTTIQNRKMANKEQLLGGNVTLNGSPATVTVDGQTFFARVYDLETGLSAEWSWEAVERIRANGGRFES